MKLFKEHITFDYSSITKSGECVTKEGILKTNKQQNNNLNKNITVKISLISKHFYCFTLRRFTRFFFVDFELLKKCELDKYCEVRWIALKMYFNMIYKKTLFIGAA